MKYLSIGNNAKTIKSDKQGEYLTAIMYLAPADIAHKMLGKKGTFCPKAEKAKCKKACLYSAGRGAFTNVQRARINKAIDFLLDPVSFVDQLKADIVKAQRKADKLNLKLAVRLNGTSDITWEVKKGSNGKTLMQDFPDVQFYDYTKLFNRKVPSNYHLTVSYSEADTDYALDAITTSKNLAVVFRDKNLPATFIGRKVINGDITDLRFTDPDNVVVGLYAKGRAVKDKTGFVIDSDIIAVG